MGKHHQSPPLPPTNHRLAQSQCELTLPCGVLSSLWTLFSFCPWKHLSISLSPSTSSFDDVFLFLLFLSLQSPFSGFWRIHYKPFGFFFSKVLLLTPLWWLSSFCLWQFYRSTRRFAGFSSPSWSCIYLLPQPKSFSQTLFIKSWNKQGSLMFQSPYFPYFLDSFPDMLTVSSHFFYFAMVSLPKRQAEPSWGSSILSSVFSQS